MKEIVRDWLVQEGILKAEVPDENAEWHFVVEFPPNSGQVSDIVKVKDKDLVLVVSGIVLSEKHYKALHSLPKEKKRNCGVMGTLCKRALQKSVRSYRCIYTNNP